MKSVMLPQAESVGRSAGSMTVDVVRAGVTPSRAAGIHLAIHLAEDSVRGTRRSRRAMYWGAGTSLGEACHDSIGPRPPHVLLPGRPVLRGYETWTLVQNPNSSAVTVEVSYLKAGGGAVSLTKSIPANSRMTFNMADKIPSGRASIVVTSKSAGKKIMVERAMYWNNKGAGTDTIGGVSD